MVILQVTPVQREFHPDERKNRGKADREINQPIQ